MTDDLKCEASSDLLADNPAGSREEWVHPSLDFFLIRTKFEEAWFSLLVTASTIAKQC